MIFVVLEGNRVVENPDAWTAKPAGGSGLVIHLVDERGEVVGNFPIKLVKYYGSTLPPHYKQFLDEQKEWAAKSPAEREADIEEARQRRKERERKEREP